MPTDRATSKPMQAGRENQVPPGAPSWVTAELLRLTIDAFQSHFPEALNPQDALDMILSASRLMDALEIDR